MLAFLSKEPESNVVPIYNIIHFGMDPGETPLHGYYSGKRDGSGLAAVAVVYNIGSLFFHARDVEAVSGMAEHIVSVGKAPFFVEGPRSHVECLLAELDAIYAPQPHPMLSERLVLRGEVNPGIDTSGTRPSRVEDLETLLAMGRAMHREMFGAEGTDEDSFRHLLRLQIEAGGAYLREESGRILCKAEGTMARPYAALIGGVYTQPAARGLGHATSCVAALCRHLLRQVETVVLTAEPDNPAAYSMYMRIGFTRAADWMVASFQEPVGTREQA